MPHYSLDMKLSELLKDPKSKAVLEKNLPHMIGHPLIWTVKHKRAKDLLQLAKGNVDPKIIENIKFELDALNM